MKKFKWKEVLREGRIKGYTSARVIYEAKGCTMKVVTYRDGKEDTIYQLPGSKIWYRDADSFLEAYKEYSKK